MMNLHNKILKWAAPLSLLLLSACSADETGQLGGGMVNADGTLTQTVHIRVDGGAQPSGPLMRDVPPGYEDGLLDENPDGTAPTCQVDRVRILTFRRLEGSNNSFVYDASNSTVEATDVEATDADFPAEENPEKRVSGKGATFEINKEKGYEYRVIALGYSTQRKIKDHRSNAASGFADQIVSEATLFKVVDKVELDAGNPDNPVPAANELKDGVSRFEDVSLQIVPKRFDTEAGFLASDVKSHLTGWYQVTPEIFYGTCRSNDAADDVIRFADSKELTGYLYRGVAELTVDLYNIEDIDFPTDSRVVNHTCGVALLADSVRQAVRLSDYEQFRTPYFLFTAAHNISGFGGETDALSTALAIDGYIDEDNLVNSCHDWHEDETSTTPVTFTTYLLPTQTRLYLRAARSHKTRVSAGSVHTVNKIRYVLLMTENASDGEQATGIIDPIAGGEFIYFRRNQRYHIKADCSILPDNTDTWRD